MTAPLPTWRERYGCEVGGCGKARLPGTARCADHPADPGPADPRLHTAARVWVETQARRRVGRRARGELIEQPRCECGDRRIHHTRLLPDASGRLAETFVPCGVYGCRCREYRPSLVAVSGAR